MALIVMPEQGFLYPLDVAPDDTTPRGLLAFARAVYTDAAAAAETYMIDNGQDPFTLANMDLYAKCQMTYYLDGVGFTGPEWPGTQMAVYVGVTPPIPDPPPSGDQGDPPTIPVEG
jgi:hypothetical protein